MAELQLSDAFVGHWVEDVPYVWVEGKGESKRRYGYKTKPFHELEVAKKCEIANYLDTIKIDKPTTSLPWKKNGRNYYQIAFYENIFRFSIAKPVTSYDALTRSVYDIGIQTVTFDMSSLVCLELSHKTTTLENTLARLEECNSLTKTTCNPCTTVGYKIAKSLIRIAATRIFAEPEQSILELPVNSIDSYNPESRVGKFGMGFFSILYWLVGHPKRSLIIESYYKTSTGYGSFHVVIQEVNEVIAFRLETNPMSEVTTTGTFIRLNATQDQFTHQEKYNFGRQLDKLEYVTNAQINIAVPHGIKNAKFLKAPNSDKQVFCYVTNTELFVEDYAKGIPLNVLLESLFVPSISTKTIALSLATKTTPYRTHIQQDKVYGCYLSFVIGGITVVQTTIQTLSNYKFVIYFPSNTRLPVSRDDVIISSTEEFVDALMELFKKAYDISVSGGHKIVYALQLLLESYTAYTPSTQNKSAVFKAMEAFYQKYKSHLVDPNHLDFFQKISPNFVASYAHDTYVLEDHLKKNFSAKIREDIWNGVYVMFIPGELTTYATNGGLPNFVFVSEARKKALGDKWVEVITSSYTQRKLYPYTKIGEGNYTKLVDLTKLAHLSPKVKETFLSTLSILKAANNSKFVMTDVSYNTIVDALLMLFTFLEDDTQKLGLLSEVISFVGKYKGNETYGGMLYYISANVPTESVYNSIYNSLQPKYFYDYLIACIRSSQTSGATILYFAKPSVIVNWGNNVFEIIVYEVLRRKSESFPEFMLFIFGYLRGINRTDIPKPLLESFVDVCLTKIRETPYNNTESVVNTLENSNRINSTPYFVECKRFTEEYFDFVFSEQMGSMKDLVPHHESEFTLTQLITSSFKDEIPFGNLEPYLKSLTKVEAKTPLQIIEIAINEGTVKPFIEAALTEMTQNSIDAIREFQPTNKSVYVAYGMNEAKTHVLLSITDFVGMSPQAFVYIGIPFLSTKAPSELVTGEMGSGFFNVYRGSDLVCIDTVKDGVIMTSYDTPIYEGARVVDVKKSIKIGKTTHANQTTITLKIPIATLEKKADVLARIENVVKNTLALALFPGDFVVNGQPTMIPRKLEFKVGKYLEVYSTTPTTPSFVLTKGIPLVSLKSFVVDIVSGTVADILDRGYLLNITHGGYTPVQTRTRINIHPDLMLDVKKAVAYMAFVYGLDKIYNGKDLWMLDNYLSFAPLDQVKLAVYSIDYHYMINYKIQDFLRYTGFDGQDSLVVLINMCIFTIGKDRTYKEAGAAVIKLMYSKYKSSNPQINNKVFAVVKRWLKIKKKVTTMVFEVKKSPAKKKSPEKKVVKEVEKERVPKANEKELDVIMEVMVDEYWTLGREGKIKGFERKAPEVKAQNTKNPVDGFLGVYSIKNHLIVYEFGYEKDSEVDLFIKLVKGKETVESFLDKMEGMTLFTKFFAETSVTSTLSHEIEHARAVEDEVGASHGEMNVSLFGGDAKRMSFQERTNEVYNNIKSRGFWKNVLYRIRLL